MNLTLRTMMTVHKQPSAGKDAVSWTVLFNPPSVTIADGKIDGAGEKDVTVTVAKAAGGTSTNISSAASAASEGVDIVYLKGGGTPTKFTGNTKVTLRPSDTSLSVSVYKRDSDPPLLLASAALVFNIAGEQGDDGAPGKDAFVESVSPVVFGTLDNGNINPASKDAVITAKVGGRDAYVVITDRYPSDLSKRSGCSIDGGGSSDGVPSASKTVLIKDIEHLYYDADGDRLDGMPPSGEEYYAIPVTEGYAIVRCMFIDQEDPSHKDTRDVTIPFSVNVQAYFGRAEQEKLKWHADYRSFKTDADQRIEFNRAQLSVQAEAIQAQVTRVNEVERYTSTVDQKADGITQTVTAMDRRLGTVSSEISNTIRRDPDTNELVGEVKVKSGQLIVETGNFQLDKDGNAEFSGTLKAAHIQGLFRHDPVYVTNIASELADRNKFVKSLEDVAEKKWIDGDLSDEDTNGLNKPFPDRYSLISNAGNFTVFRLKNPSRDEQIVKLDSFKTWRTALYDVFTGDVVFDNGKWDFARWQAARSLVGQTVTIYNDNVLPDNPAPISGQLKVMGIGYRNNDGTVSLYEEADAVEARYHYIYAGRFATFVCRHGYQDRKNHYNDCVYWEVLDEGAFRDFNESPTVCYVGSAGATMTAAVIPTLMRRNIETLPNLSGKVHCNHGEYVWWCIPVSANLVPAQGIQAKSNIFGVPLADPVTVTYGGAGYKCYRTYNMLKKCNLNYIISEKENG